MRSSLSSRKLATRFHTNLARLRKVVLSQSLLDFLYMNQDVFLR